MAGAMHRQGGKRLKHLAEHPGLFPILIQVRLSTVGMYLCMRTFSLLSSHSTMRQLTRHHWLPGVSGDLGSMSCLVRLTRIEWNPAACTDHACGAWLIRLSAAVLEKSVWV